MFYVPVALFTNNSRSNLTRFDRHRLINDSLLFGVITHLDVAVNREVLAERMTNETIIRKYPAQIGMTRKDNPVQIEGFTLKPVNSVPD